MKFCMHDVHPLRSFSSSFHVKTRRWGRERAEMRDTRSVVERERVAATPLQRRPISKERSAAFLDKCHYSAGGCRRESRNMAELGTFCKPSPAIGHSYHTFLDQTATRTTAKHKNLAPTDLFDPRLYPPKMHIFGHFGVVLADLGGQARQNSCKNASSLFSQIPTAGLDFWIFFRSKTAPSGSWVALGRHLERF